ncbi:MAG: hypothetical protein HFJ47_02505 [Clostridia bacterium]|nr:hypothetical protein [Clostridia bacterium]
MENATKALLIAAAVLIAILIISLGIAVYRMAAEAMQGADLTGAEITKFNATFEGYEGEVVAGSRVNALLKTVLTHNLKNKDAGKQVTITGAVTLNPADKALPDNRADTGKTYKVKCTYGDAGLITTITVTLNSSK